MAAYFFDSSAVVKRYLAETGTAWILGIVDPAQNNHIHVSRITGVEVVAAITRRTRTGSLSTANAAMAVSDFRYDFTTAYRAIDITPSLIISAMQLAEAHALRGYDAVQLATALEVNVQALSLGLSPLTLVSSDTDLNIAAIAEGLKTDDPNLHS